MRVTLALDGVTLFDGADEPKADTVRAIAVFFAGLTDDEQAQFFALAADSLAASPAPGALWGQGWSIGRHMQTCACIGEDAREFFRAIYTGLTERPS